MKEPVPARQVCHSEIMKFRINVNFDSSEGEHSDEKSWTRWCRLFQCVFLPWSAALMEFLSALK